MAWPKQSPQRWAKLMPQCTVRERDLFGFPRPGDDYWNEQTLADVGLRYPGMDVQPYRGTRPAATAEEAPAPSDRVTRALDQGVLRSTGRVGGLAGADRSDDGPPSW